MSKRYETLIGIGDDLEKLPSNGGGIIIFCMLKSISTISHYDILITISSSLILTLSFCGIKQSERKKRLAFLW